MAFVLDPAVAVYIAWVTEAVMTGWSVRGMAAIVFALGFAACLTGQKQMAVVYGTIRDGSRPPVAYLVLASVIGALALVTAVIAVVTGSAAMLATLAAAVGGLWVIATARHMLSAGSGGPSRRPAKGA